MTVKVAINRFGPVDFNAHLLPFDPDHGRSPGHVASGENTIDVGRGKSEVTIISGAADRRMAGIPGVTDRPDVSMDFNHDSRSSIFHMDQTKVTDGRMGRILSWYDTEWGFSNRMADTAVAMGRLI